MPSCAGVKSFATLDQMPVPQEIGVRVSPEVVEKRVVVTAVATSQRTFGLHPSGARFHRGRGREKGPCMRHRKTTRGPGDRRGAHSSTAPGEDSRGGAQCESGAVGANVQVSAW